MDTGNINNLVMLMASGRSESILPLILILLKPYIEKVINYVIVYIKEFFKKYQEPVQKYYECQIVGSDKVNSVYSFQNNFLLQEAIRFHIKNINFDNSNVQIDDVRHSSVGSYNHFVTKVPYYNEWNYITNEEPKILLMIFDKSEKIDEKVNENKLIYKLKCKDKDHLYKFVQRIYTEYNDYKNSTVKKDTNKYLIHPITVKLCNRYLLSNQKTLDSIFFEQKTELMSILDNFKNKTGIYEFSSIQNKLGILLHGPPGTGKTSLIKAVANYLNRHIVNIELSKINSYQDLIKIFYGSVFRAHNSIDSLYWDMNLPNDKVIFIIEDIDAMGSIVKKRSITKENDDDDFLKTVQEVHFRKIEDKVEQTKNLKKHENEKDDEKKNDEKKNDEIKNVKEVEPISWKLNLSDILNVLDGVLDSPGRLIIMTSNCPEDLDDALTRPGRIDYKLYLGTITYNSLIEMLEYYKIKDITMGSGLKEKIPKEKITKTPAEVESYLIKKNLEIDIEEFSKFLITKSNPFSKKNDLKI